MSTTLFLSVTSGGQAMCPRGTGLCAQPECTCARFLVQNGNFCSFLYPSAPELHPRKRKKFLFAGGLLQQQTHTDEQNTHVPAGTLWAPDVHGPSHVHFYRKAMAHTCLTSTRTGAHMCTHPKVPGAFTCAAVCRVSSTRTRSCIMYISHSFVQEEQLHI